MISVLLFFSAQLFSIVRGVFSNPAYLFVGYTLVYFMYHQRRWWYSMVPSLSYSFVISALIVFLALFPRKRTSTTLLSVPPLKYLILLSGYMVVVQAWAFLPDKHWYDTENFLKVTVVMLAAFKLCKTERDIHKYTVGFLIGAAYIGYYVLEVGRSAYGRVEGVGTVDAPDVNDMAAILASASIFALHYFWRSQNLVIKSLCVIGGALILNALVLMNSRGAFLGVILGAGFYVWSIFKSNVQINYKKFKVIGIVLAGLVSLSLIVDDQAITRFMSLKENTTLVKERQTGSTRVYFWLASLDMASDYPMGAGTGAFIALSPSYIPLDIDSGGSRNRAVHSTWFQVLTEVGYPGTLVFIMMIVSSFLLLLKIKRYSERYQKTELYFFSTVLQAGFISFLVAATFLDRFRAVVLYFFILFASASYNVFILQPNKNGQEGVENA